MNDFRAFVNAAEEIEALAVAREHIAWAMTQPNSRPRTVIQGLVPPGIGEPLERYGGRAPDWDDAVAAVAKAWRSITTGAMQRRAA